VADEQDLTDFPTQGYLPVCALSLRKRRHVGNRGLAYSCTPSHKVMGGEELYSSVDRVTGRNVNS